MGQSLFLRGTEDLGTRKKHYSATFSMSTAVDFLLVVLFFGGALIRAAKHPHDSEAISLFFILGVVFLVYGIYEYKSQKEEYLDVYEKGLRGKGESGGLFSVFNIKMFEFSYDKIVQIEVKKVGFTESLCITTKEGEIMVNIFDPLDALWLIQKLTK